MQERAPERLHWSPAGTRLICEGRARLQRSALGGPRALPYDAQPTLTATVSLQLSSIDYSIFFIFLFFCIIFYRFMIIQLYPKILLGFYINISVVFYNLGYMSNWVYLPKVGHPGFGSRVLISVSHNAV